MPKKINEAKIAVLTCSFVPPIPKTVPKLDDDIVEKISNFTQQEYKLEQRSANITWRRKVEKTT